MFTCCTSAPSRCDPIGPWWEQILPVSRIESSIFGHSLCIKVASDLTSWIGAYTGKDWELEKKEIWSIVCKLVWEKAQSLWIIVPHIKAWQRQKASIIEENFKHLGGQDGPSYWCQSAHFSSSSMFCTGGSKTGCPWRPRWDYLWVQQCGFPLPKARLGIAKAECTTCQWQQPV